MTSKPPQQTTASARIVDCVGIHNFRDYGGYPLQGGGRLKTGVLYRSGQHKDASPEDLTRVRDLGLKSVIDLRGPSERRHAPCPRPEGFGAQVFFVDDETAGLAPHLRAAEGTRTPAQAADGMRVSYSSMPFRPQLREILRTYFRVLATAPGPSLVHCLAGKDRTGLAVALLHTMLGVHRDDMLADYVLTNEAGRVEARVAAGASALRKIGGETLSDDVLRVLMSVHPRYIETAFAAIEARHGTVDAYLTDHLQVTPPMRAQIKAHLAG